MQSITLTMLIVVAYAIVAGFLMTWAASNSQSYIAHRVHLAISRIGYFVAFYLASLLPFLNGTFQPVIENQPIAVIGIIGGMIFAYYVPQLQLGWHRRLRSTKS